MTTAAAKITAEQHRVGNGTLIWWAFIDGVMLRDKRGVGRRFTSEAAALYAAADAACAA